MWEDSVCHRMAHFVLIRCYLQLSLAEALPWCYLCLLHTDRTSPEVRMCGWLRLSPHGALTCLYGVTYCRASPRLFLGAIFVCYIRTAPPRGASRGGGYPVTAWRTSCLYGVSHSRTSPMYFRWRHLRLLHTDRTSPRCR